MPNSENNNVPATGASSRPGAAVPFLRLAGGKVAAARISPVPKTPEKINRVASLFTPCTLADSLLEAVTEAAKNATAGDVVFVSPACSSFDRSQNYQQRRERFCQRVKSISRGRQAADPNMNGESSGNLKQHRVSRRTCSFSLRGFLRENHGANDNPNSYLTERTPQRQIQ